MKNYRIFCVFCCLVPLILGESFEEDVIQSISDQLENRKCTETMAGLGDGTTLNCSGLYFETVGMPSNVEVSLILKLDLSNNLLVEIECNIFSNMRTLKYLNLSVNHINVIEAGAFYDLKNLEKLDISSNLLESLNSDLFSPLANLKYLDLSSNRLHKLPSRLPMLEWFDISNNIIQSLTELPYSTLLYPQQVFLLGGNPLICDCELFWLKELLDTRKYILKFSKFIAKEKFYPKCAEPKTLEGKSWELLSDNQFKCSDKSSHAVNREKQTDRNLNTKGILVTADDVTKDSIIVEWTNIEYIAGASIEIKFHKFGEKKTAKTVMLPLEAQSYRLKKLQPNSPYVICYKVQADMGDLIQQDCLEVITKEFVKMSRHSVIEYISSILQATERHSMAILFTVVILALTVITMKFKKKMNHI